MKTVLEKSEGIDQKIAALKIVRQEIDLMIEELLRKKQDLNLTEMAGIVNEVKITPTTVTADNVEVAMTEKKIMIKVKERNMELGSKNGKVLLQDGLVNVTADELSISPDGNLTFKNNEINTLPSEMIAKLKINAKKIEIRMENGKPVYSLSTEEAKNILGLIPVQMEKEVIVDATSGDAKVLQENKPWWSFLAF
jgi:hypothetical protein